MIRRRAILETADVSEIRKAAFSLPNGSPDLSVSTYETDNERFVQLRTEHCAAASNDRPSASALLDVSGLHDAPISTNGNDWFSYSADAHRELKFPDEAALLTYITKVITANTACYDIETSACRDYLGTVATDPEWMRFFEEHPNGAGWRAMAEKKRAR